MIRSYGLRYQQRYNDNREDEIRMRSIESSDEVSVNTDPTHLKFQRVCQKSSDLDQNHSSLWFGRSIWLHHFVRFLGLALLRFSVADALRWLVVNLLLCFSSFTMFDLLLNLLLNICICYSFQRAVQVRKSGIDIFIVIIQHALFHSTDFLSMKIR